MAVRYNKQIKTRVKPHVGKQHIIELNGKRYNAVTGEIISNNSLAPVKPAHIHPAPKAATKRMDGFSVPNPKTQKSQTLMRQLVQKPVAQKAQAAVSVPAKITHQIQASKQVSAHKLARANSVPKSTLIQKFGSNTQTIKPLSKTAAKPAPIIGVQKIAVASAMKADPLAKGLANATSHEHAKLKRSPRHTRLAHRLRISPRLLSAGTLVLAGLLLGGFFAYQNIPNINMRLASARSGVQGSLPGYQPNGFGIKGGITYKPGQISIGYKSNSDERNFKITQTTTAWDSNSLLNSYVAVNRRDYQTIEDRGKTVYIYDGSNATWVDGGIWYRVEGNSQLNSEQLQSIANSL